MAQGMMKVSWFKQSNGPAGEGWLHSFVSAPNGIQAIVLRPTGYFDLVPAACIKTSEGDLHKLAEKSSG